MSLKELSLSFMMATSPGYVLVTFACHKFIAYPPNPYDCWMSVAFEVELGSLADLIAWSQDPAIDPRSQPDAGAL